MDGWVGPNADTVWTTGFLSDGRRFAGGEVGETVLWGATPITVEGVAES